MNSIIFALLKPNLAFTTCKRLFATAKFHTPRAEPDAHAFKKHKKHKKFPLYEGKPLQLAPKVQELPKQKFDYFLVLDFEATCDSPVNLDPQEIIEFPVLKINGATLERESKFHSYVKPVVNPELTDFCTELTGIIQGVVDNSPEFPEVFKNFQTWMKEEQILDTGAQFAFVTCGDPDLDYLLPLQCQVSEISVPDYMKQWINIKRSFCEIRPYTWPDNLSAMLKYCELEHIGDLHSGVDDAINIARVLRDLAERGHVFTHNGWKKT
ncbi:hypothetical protein JTE90_029524 [Oedothorax gibbosus]|uniref:Exonuclease domain-containing protein n=1 Tax=Oedothorax gibbosus TaxID=931172 RepID=A0AAV6VCU3_9ARAC|nr:hypothetical protein JTE90_029524 [Oedothorax gibbosus]